jgi:RNA-directed DNA polymerase
MTLYKRQGQKCPMCKQYITLETGGHVHHIVEKHLGGSDNLDNLVLLHPNCHMQWHAS